MFSSSSTTRKLRILRLPRREFGPPQQRGNPPLILSLKSNFGRGVIAIHGRPHRRINIAIANIELPLIKHIPGLLRDGGDGPAASQGRGLHLPDGHHRRGRVVLVERREHFRGTAHRRAGHSRRGARTVRWRVAEVADHWDVRGGFGDGVEFCHCVC